MRKISGHVVQLQFEYSFEIDVTRFRKPFKLN